MKFFRNKINIIISLLLVVTIVLMLFSSQRFTKSSVEGIVGQGLNPIQRFIYSVTTTISNTYKGIIKYSEIVEENKTIKKENGELVKKVNDYNDLLAENERLREVLNFKNELGEYDFVGVNIVGKNGGPYVNDYIVDLGYEKGLQTGMVVVSNGGLFGMITSVAKGWSIVSPIIDGTISVSGVVQRTNGNEGILKGYKSYDGKNILKMEELPLDEDVVEGDVVLSSGLGGVYPSGIQIGEVVSIETDNRRGTKVVYVEPYFDFDFVGELFIVLPKDIENVRY